MDNLFINYRRDDSAPQAKLIAKALGEVVHSDQIFLDTDSIDIGTEWPNSIQTALEKSNIVLIVIGPNWLKAGINEWGQRRIDNENDWVRKEIANSLVDPNKKIIPILVEGATIPPESALPDCIKQITKKQAIEIRRNYWDHDIKLLIAKFQKNINFSLNSIGPAIDKYWNNLAPNLQDAFVLAANDAKRKGKDIISTRTFFAALNRLNPDRLPEFFDEIPKESLPTPTSNEVKMDQSALKEINLFSNCVKTSIDTLIDVAVERKITTEDMFIDIAKNGTGQSVRKLRRFGVDEDRIKEIVNQLGWTVIERKNKADNNG